MFKKALVPIDGSDISEGILPYVSYLCQKLDIPVLLVSVIDPGYWDFRVQLGERVGPWEAAMTRRLTAIAERLRSQGLQADFLVVHGRPQTEILRAAKERGCNLIAMSTKGRGLMGWAMLGSVTYNIVHASTFPVLTVAPEKALALQEQGVSISRIPVPLDGSELAEASLEYASHLSHALSAEILLVTVVSTVQWLPSPLREMISQKDEEQAKQEAEDYVRGVASMLQARGLRVSWRVLEGVPAPSIVELSQESPEDLIVMSTRGRTGIVPGVLGSVCISVLRNSPDPVLIIPPPRK